MKETFYFQHDYNAHKDPRCGALLADYGAEGYGLYWALVEIMHQEGGRIEKFPKLFKGLAYQLSVGEEKLTEIVTAMIFDYQLFVEDDEHIWSERVLLNFEIRDEKKRKKVEAGRLGGVRSGISRSKPKQTEAPLQKIEANEAKERKGKERKRNKTTSKEVGASPHLVGFGNDEINKMLSALKGKIEIEDFADAGKWSRIYAKHCLNLIKKIGKDEFVRRLDIILQDDFKRKNCNKIKFVYNEIKGFIQPKLNTYEIHG
jgi:hypothetical protein